MTGADSKRGLGNIAIRPLDDSTLGDFRALFAARFPDGNAEVIEEMLTNPAQDRGHPMGFLAYDAGGRTIAIQGIALRKAFHGRDEVKVGLAMAMAVAKDVDRSFFTPFLKRSMEDFGADLIFGNTAIPGSRKRLQAAIGVKDGPDSCAAIRGLALRNQSVFARKLRRVFAKIGLSRKAMRANGGCVAIEGDLRFRVLAEIDATQFDGFWTRYLKTNKGLVASRTAEELRWMFAKSMELGEVMLLAAERNGQMCAYAFLKRTDESASCWRVADMIALDNDVALLERLLRAAAGFLRKHTPAEYFQMTGYPDWIAPMVSRLFPQKSEVGYNRCIWRCMNADAEASCGGWLSDANSWYGCPYDGDMAML